MKAKGIKKSALRNATVISIEHAVAIKGLNRNVARSKSSYEERSVAFCQHPRANVVNQDRYSHELTSDWCRSHDGAEQWTSKRKQGNLDQSFLIGVVCW